MHDKRRRAESHRLVPARSQERAVTAAAAVFRQGDRAAEVEAVFARDGTAPRGGLAVDVRQPLATGPGAPAHVRLFGLGPLARLVVFAPVVAQNELEHDE